MIVRWTLITTVLLSLSRARGHNRTEQPEPEIDEDLEGRSFTIDQQNQPTKLYTGLAGTDIRINVPIVGSNVPNKFELLKAGRVTGYNKVIKLKSLPSGRRVVSVLFGDTGPGDTGAFTLKMTNRDNVVRVFDFSVKILTAPLRLNGMNNTVHQVIPVSNYNINVSIGGAPLPVEFSVRKDGNPRFRRRNQFKTSFTKFNASTGVLQIKIAKITNALRGQYAVKITNEVGSSTWFGFSITAGLRGKAKIEENNQYLVLAMTVLLWVAAAALVVIGIMSLVRTSRTLASERYEFGDMEDNYYVDDLEGEYKSDFELEVFEESQLSEQGERHTSI